jgi:hypothetical protein
MPENEEVQEVSAPPRSNRRLLVAGLILFFVTTLTSAIYIDSQRREADRRAEEVSRMSMELNQTRAELDSVKSNLNSMAAQAAAAPAPAPETATAPRAARPVRKAAHASRRKKEPEPNVAPTEKSQWGNMMTELADHQKQIDSTRQDLERTRAEMDGKISSTRDELNSTIARNHEELIALRKRGEKDYFEFDLTKSKQFSKIGPLSIALRKSQPKKLFCDLELVVDDSKIKKNHINLYEPMFLYPADYGQPLEVVINSISKDAARGYVSVPKFRKSELATNASTPSDMAAPTAEREGFQRRAVANPAN